jgi:hypothetical protein
MACGFSFVRTQDNPPLKMFPQKGFISGG